jgi:hypothetical protein
VTVCLPGLDEVDTLVGEEFALWEATARFNISSNSLIRARRRSLSIVDVIGWNKFA